MPYSKGLKWLFFLSILTWVLFGILVVSSFFIPIAPVGFGFHIAIAGVITGVTWFQWQMEEIERKQ